MTKTSCFKSSNCFAQSASQLGFLYLVKIHDNYKITQVNITPLPSICQAKCIYCYSKGLCSTYEQAKQSTVPMFMASMLRVLRNRGILDSSCFISGTYGEITIAPHKDLIYDAVEKNVSFFCTNGFVFDQRLAELLKVEGSNINVNMDAGTRETYKIVKGFDMFDRVIRNIKEYQKYGQVIMKYIIMAGVNDSDEEIDGTVKILQELGIKELKLSYDFLMPIKPILYPLTKFISNLKKNGIKPTIPDFLHTLNGVDVLRQNHIEINEGLYAQRNSHLREMFRTKRFIKDYFRYRIYVYLLETEDLLKSFKPEVKFALVEKHYRSKHIRVLEQLRFKYYDNDIPFDDVDIIIARKDAFTDKKYVGRVLDIRANMYSLEPARIFLERIILQRYLI